MFRQGEKGLKEVESFQILVRSEQNAKSSCSGDKAVGQFLNNPSFKQRKQSRSSTIDMRNPALPVGPDFGEMQRIQADRNKGNRPHNLRGRFPSASSAAATGSGPSPPSRSRYQKSALPVVRGKGSTSRMLAMPVRYMIMRSKPMPKPACSAVPYLRSSRYHQ